jgi:hypothetical protein
MRVSGKNTVSAESEYGNSIPSMKGLFLSGIKYDE